MVFDRYLQGGEPVEVLNASPNGPLRFNLPQCVLNIAVKVAGQTQKPQANLETVLIEPDDERLCLVWKAEVPCDKKALKVEEIAVNVVGMKLNGSTT